MEPVCLAGAAPVQHLLVMLSGWVQTWPRAGEGREEPLLQEQLQLR